MRISDDMIAEICELYMGHHMPPTHIAKKLGISPAAVNRAIDNTLNYKKLDYENTELITGYFNFEKHRDGKETERTNSKEHS